MHKPQNSSCINSITEKLNLTEDCCDLKQMIGSLAQPQKEPPAERTLHGQEPWQKAKCQGPWPRATAMAKSHGQEPPRPQIPHPARATNDTRLKYHGATPRDRKPYMIHKVTGKIILLDAPVQTNCTLTGLATRPGHSQ